MSSLQIRLHKIGVPEKAKGIPLEQKSKRECRSKAKKALITKTLLIKILFSIKLLYKIYLSM